MAEFEELSRRIATLEKQGSSRISFFVQYLLSPMLLLLISVFFNHQLERAKQSLQRTELEVRRIEATRGFLGEFFSGTPERAFVAERLISKIVEEKLAAEISAIVKDYYTQKVEAAIARKDVEEASNIKAAADAIQSPASKHLIEKLQQPVYYVVVASLSSESEAIASVKALRTKGLKSEAVLSNTGFYAVTLGPYTFAEANEVRKRAVEAGDARNDAYLMSKARVIRTVF